MVGLDLGGWDWLGIWLRLGKQRGSGRLGQRGLLGFERAGLAWDSTRVRRGRSVSLNQGGSLDCILC